MFGGYAEVTGESKRGLLKASCRGASWICVTVLFSHHVLVQDDSSLFTSHNDSFLLFMMDEVHLHSPVFLVSTLEKIN